MTAYAESFEQPLAVEMPRLFPACYLAEVVKVKDDDYPGRVQVKLHGYDGVTNQDGPMWAWIAAPFAGPGRGAFMMPDTGDQVLVSFINGDPRGAVVIGSLWHGQAAPPDQLGGDRQAVDRWTIVAKAGTRIAVVEETSGQATITLATPAPQGAQPAAMVTIDETGGGKIELTAGGTTVTIDSQGFDVQTAASVTMNSSQLQATAGDVSVTSAQAIFSGNVQCATTQCGTVIAGTITPAAGNVM